MNPFSIILGVGLYAGIRDFLDKWQDVQREVNRQLPPVDYSRSDWREQAWARSELRSQIIEARRPEITKHR